jgi:putative membrane protein
VIRLVVRTAIMLVANAVGLIVAASLLDGMSLNWAGLLWATVIYTVVFALMQPFLALQARRRATPLLGGVALIASLVALIVADIISDGLNISGIGTWIAAAVIVWVASLLAAFILPFLGLKKYLQDEKKNA